MDSNKTMRTFSRLSILAICLLALSIAAWADAPTPRQQAVAQKGDRKSVV